MDYYQMCCKHRGKVVTIYEKCGRRHYGRIVNVDHQFVYIEPVHPHSGGLGGFSYGFYGGWGFRPWGVGVVPIALAAIGGFALASAFLWW
ncbi:MAG: hypothetical protein LPK26_12255 [Bacillaceae bacterium]|uniref:Uncharacterized protein n=1 Tax=Alkalihalobacterium chitinilyticum TaxID=2980103 RepID=A0ABT5VHU6_9BACI|nr:hypothetical protein [Alkalihalobacterium chitinilyticum]MDE5415025.1 hypothetical protein [Alkalihalobacterium chitinilyticum]MEB1808043.1 hypothetical protein [Bacillaceae bacterium]